MPELPANCKDFRGFDLNQLDTACQKLKMNGYIFDCELTDEGRNGSAGCLSWRSKFVDSGWDEHIKICDRILIKLVLKGGGGYTSHHFCFLIWSFKTGKLHFNQQQQNLQQNGQKIVWTLMVIKLN